MIDFPEPTQDDIERARRELFRTYNYSSMWSVGTTAVMTSCFAVLISLMFFDGGVLHAVVAALLSAAFPLGVFFVVELPHNRREAARWARIYALSRKIMGRRP